MRDGLRSHHFRFLAALLLMITSSVAHAAVCQFNQTSGAWNNPANWNSCTGGNGVPAGTPGPADRAEIPASNTAILPAGTFNVGDIYLPAATIQGAGIGTTTLNVVSGGTIAGGSGTYTFTNLTMTIAAPSPMFAISGPWQLNSTDMTLLAGTTLNLADLAINGAGAIFRNLGDLNLQGNLSANASSGFFNNAGGNLTAVNSLTLGGTFNNQGRISIGGGVVVGIPVAGQFTQPAVSGKIEGGGTVVVTGSPFALAAGSVEGNLTITAATLQNSGARIKPGGNNAIGTITINGDYTQSGTGVMEFEFASASTFDQLQVNGNMDVNYMGTTEVKLGVDWPAIFTYTPNPGDTFNVVNFSGSLTGVIDFYGTPVNRGAIINHLANTIQVQITTAVFVVTNVADSGPGSLRDAITQVNAGGCANGPYEIHLNVAGTLAPSTALPALVCATTVTGRAAPGTSANTSTTDWNGILAFNLDGTSCPGCAGLTFNAADSVAEHINFANWSTAVQVNGAAARFLAYGNYFFQGGRGVSVSGNVDAQIGVSGDPGSRNVFVHATGAGIFTDLKTSVSPRLNIENNLIGLGAGLVAGPNVRGIEVGSSNGVDIKNNIIANNGIGIAVASGNQIRYPFNNQIYANTTSGIDLGIDGATANDQAAPPYDTDSGPNLRQNHPTLSSAVDAGATIDVALTLKTAGMGTNYQINLCASNVLSEDQCRSGPVSVIAATDGTGLYSGTLSVPKTGRFTPPARITAFACDLEGPKLDNCSEISPGVNVITAAPAVSITGSGAFPGTVVGGSSAVQAITITNTGTGVLTITSISNSAAPKIKDTTGGPSPSLTHYCGFGSDAMGAVNTGTPIVLMPMTACVINAVYSPTAPGPTSGVLTVVSDAPGSPHTLPLSGTGVLAATPTMTAAFAPTTVLTGATSILTLTLSNPNGTPAGIGGGSVTLPTGLNGVAPMSNSCGTFGSFSAQTYSFGMGSIPAMGSCTIDLSVSSAVANMYMVNIPAGALNAGPGMSTNTSTATLTVTPTPTPAVTFSAVTVAFPLRTINTTSTPTPVTLTNTGTAPLTISNITSAGDFAFTSTCPLSPSTLPATGSCTINITFTPLTATALAGNVTVTSDAPGSPHVISLSGSGTAMAIPGIALSAAALNLGSATVGTTGIQQSIVVSNTGFSTLTLTVAVTGPFTRVTPVAAMPLNCGASLAPGATCQIAALFNPAVAGAATGQINIAHNAPGSPSLVALSGIGTVVPVAVISLPTRIDFADQVINTTSAQQVLTITNTGTAAMTVTSITLAGTNAANFTVGGTCATIAAGANCPITLTFRPVSAGVKSAQVNIVSNASNAATVNRVDLGGNGVLAQRPVADLSITTVGFGNSIFGGATPSQLVTLRNIGGATMSISSIFTVGDFVVMHSCPGNLGSGASCQINVLFSPLGLGNRSGELQILTNTLESPGRVILSGTGCRWFSPSQSRLFLTTCG